MERIYTKTSCPLYGTQYCESLNMESCQACTLKCETQAQAEVVMADLDAYAALMPEEGITGLFATDECVLCRGENKGKKKWYGFTDLANPQPRRHKTGFLGVAKERRAGAVLPVQLGCCDDCRRRMLRLEYIMPVMMALFTVIPLGIFSVRGIREPLMAVSHGLPFYLFAACVLLGALLGRWIKKGMVRQYAAHTYLKVIETPALAPMKEKGWFELNGEGDMSRVVFARRPAAHGLYTTMPANAAPIQENETVSGKND